MHCTGFIAISITAVSKLRCLSHVCFLPAVMCVAVLAVSVTCLSVIQQNVQKGRVNWVWNTASAPPNGLSTTPGESFFIMIIALIFSLPAAILSYRSHPESVVPTQVYSEEQEDRERECLITDPESDEDVWGD